MKLVYRGIKYSSNNSTALKIVREQKHKIGRLIDSKKFYKGIVSYKFPVYQYLRQLFRSDSNYVRNPNVFWCKYMTMHLETCWKSSEKKILDSCWKMTLEQEQKMNESSTAIANNSRQVFKYRGVTYYK
ncbi:MAG: hypothetical protein ACFCAD_04405 [Pleurocapsa sp.]